jgi:hypothetical protein
MVDPISGKWPRRLLALALGTAVALGGVYALLSVFVHGIPPCSITHGSMLVLRSRVMQYAREHGVLPTAIEELPVNEGAISQMTDGWGGPIEMIVSDEEITFRSLGRDAQAGGTGDDRDMIGVFSPREPDGRWAHEFADWVKDPLADE